MSDFPRITVPKMPDLTDRLNLSADIPPNPAFETNKLLREMLDAQHSTNGLLSDLISEIKTVRTVLENGQ